MLKTNVEETLKSVENEAVLKTKLGQIFEVAYFICVECLFLAYPGETEQKVLKFNSHVV